MGYHAQEEMSLVLLKRASHFTSPAFTPHSTSVLIWTFSRTFANRATSRPDMTSAVDWALKAIIYLSIAQQIVPLLQFSDDGPEKFTIMTVYSFFVVYW